MKTYINSTIINSLKKMVKDLNLKTVLSVLLVYYVSILALLSYLTDSKLDIVFISTLPFLLYLVMFSFILKKELTDARIIWLAPLIFPVLFLLIWTSAKVDIDIPVVIVLNITFSYLGNAVIMYISKFEGTKEDRLKRIKDDYAKTQRVYQEELDYLRHSLREMNEKFTRQDFKVSLRSIEDKCKSINFSIGRVYGKKNGGNSILRESIKIPKELYNDFSELITSFKKEHAPELLKLLELIYERLINMEYPEMTVFPPGKYEDLKLNRDTYGRDKIIDVLNRNDQDPVKEYHLEAKEVCIKLGNYLRQIV